MLNTVLGSVCTVVVDTEIPGFLSGVGRERETMNVVWCDTTQKHLSAIETWKNEWPILHGFPGQYRLNVRESFHRAEGIWARPLRLIEGRRKSKQNHLTRAPRISLSNFTCLFTLALIPQRIWSSSLKCKTVWNVWRINNGLVWLKKWNAEGKSKFEEASSACVHEDLHAVLEG